MSIKHRSFRVLGCYLLLAVLSLATLSVRANSTEKDASSCRDYGQIRSRHLLFGLPKVKVSERFNIKQKDGQVIEGISILVRDGFVIGHNDKRKVPAWTSKRWNRDDLNETKIHKSRFAFQSDSDRSYDQEHRTRNQYLHLQRQSLSPGYRLRHRRS